VDCKTAAKSASCCGAVMPEFAKALTRRSSIDRSGTNGRSRVASPRFSDRRGRRCLTLLNERGPGLQAKAGTDV
jgi:hypothetical protein